MAVGPLISLLLILITAETLGHEPAPGVRRVYVAVGDDAVLPCSPNTNMNLEPVVFDWIIYGPPREEVFLYQAGLHYNNGRPGQSEKFKGRVSHFSDHLKYSNASIKIRNVRLTDARNYTCIFPNLQPRQTFQVELIVGAKPVISTLEETHDWSLLKCEVRGVSPEARLEWQDSEGNVLPADKPQVTEIGGSFDKTVQITVNQADRYRCVLIQEDTGHRSAAEEFVQVCGAPKPYVTILDQTHDWSKLQCEVRGALTKPTLQWQDSAGIVLRAEEPKVTERRGSFDIIGQIVVTQTDRYRCVVTQEKILRPADSETFVRVNEGASAKEIIGLLFGGMLLGASILAAVQAVLRAKKIITLSLGKASDQKHGYHQAEMEEDHHRPSENGNGALHSEKKDNFHPAETSKSDV